MNEKEKRLKNKIVLITGASRGIGRSVALRFAKEGAHLIILARTTGALEALDDQIRDLTGNNSTLIPFDLENTHDIKNLSHEVHNRFKRLDVLVGNAGILGGLSPINDITSDTWQTVLNVNLNANWQLINCFNPLLKRSKAGRVIFVTSSVGSRPRAYWGAYSVSKAALEMLTKIYAQEQIKSHINVNLINPGATRTRMRAEAMPGEDSNKLKHPDEVTEYFVQLAEDSCLLNGVTIDCNKDKKDNTS